MEEQMILEIEQVISEWKEGKISFEECMTKINILSA